MYNSSYDNGYGQMQDQNFGSNGGMMDPYQQQQAMLMMQQQGMGPYAFDQMQQPILYDVNGFPIQGEGFNLQMQQAVDDQQGYNMSYDTGYGNSINRSNTADDGDLKKRKSFSGPPDGERLSNRSRSGRSIHRSPSTKKSGGGSSGKGTLARNGSLFQMGGDERSTQRSVSTRGGMDSGSNGPDDEELSQYYGDMSKRYGDQTFDGFKALKSYRGEIEDGQDVGKPRRVIGARNLQGKGSTGYGGLSYKRQCAMRNGEGWGDIEIRRHGNDGEEEPTPRARGIGFNMNDDARRQHEMEEQMRRMREAEMMAAMQQQMMDQPAVPHVFLQEDVHSYSNLSDAFSEDSKMDEDESEF